MWIPDNPGALRGSEAKRGAKRAGLGEAENCCTPRAFGRNGGFGSRWKRQCSGSVFEVVGASVGLRRRGLGFDVSQGDSGDFCG